MVRPVQKPTFCPQCYLQGGEDIPLISQPGAHLKCERKHSFEDMDTFQELNQRAKAKRAQIELQANPEGAKPIDKDKTFSKKAGDEISITRTDIDRLTKILGEFVDGSSLFGCVYSLNQDLATAKDTIAALEERIKTNQSKPSIAMMPGENAITQSKDLIMPLTIPEEHIQPLRDVSENNHTTLEEYVTAVVHNGLENNWFY